MKRFEILLETLRRIIKIMTDYPDPKKMRQLVTPGRTKSYRRKEM